MDIVNSIANRVLHHFNMMQCSTLDTVGLAAMVLAIAKILKATVYTPFKLYFLAQYLPGVDLRKLGEWAVVTGATDGIGE